MRTCRFLALLLLWMPFTLAAQSSGKFHTIALQHDSLPNIIQSHWRYHTGDDAAWALPSFNDSSWTTRPSLTLKGLDTVRPGSFPGVAWFRIPIKADSKLAGQPLALSTLHAARARIFLDGVELFTIGNSGLGKDTAEDQSPFKLPVIFTLPDTASHLLAIRFAYPPNQDTDDEGHKGISFNATVNTAPAAIREQNRQTVLFSSVTIFFFTFFFAFALIHLVLYLFNRKAPSNLWFSLFCIGLGFLFLAAFLALAAGSSKTNSIMEQYGMAIIAFTCASISAFVNNLFGWGRMRYWIARIMFVAGLLTIFIGVVEDYLVPALIALVFIEAIVLIIRAISEGVPGARIIGAGVLFFAIAVISLFVFILSGPGATFTISDTSGYLIIVGGIVAIISIPLSMSAYLAWSFSTINRRLSRQLSEVERLSNEARQHEAEKQKLMQSRQEELEQVVSTRTEELRNQKEKSDELLRNILPAEVAEELKEKGSTSARMYDNVSVLFTDFADFTQMAESLTAAELVAELDECFSAFDAMITSLGLEKIKTVGDAYIAVSGLPTEDPRHAYKVVTAALEIQAYMRARKSTRPNTFNIRLGVHSGPVIAGIVGVKKFAYDIWGDTVNTAARMEQHSDPGKINISAATYALVSDEFSCHYRGELEAKHKGRLGMYFVEAPVLIPSA